MRRSIKLRLGAPAEEATACRAAWAAAPYAKYGVHIHHEAACEVLTEPIENRIAYILREKPEGERALRLRLMRPTTAPAWKAYEAARAPAHRLVCSTPGCPWGGNTIFAGGE